MENIYVRKKPQYKTDLIFMSSISKMGIISCKYFRLALAFFFFFLPTLAATFVLFFKLG